MIGKMLLEEFEQVIQKEFAWPIEEQKRKQFFDDEEEEDGEFILGCEISARGGVGTLEPS
ncbi:unnamed protein product [Meloidogyne enterolobii]|uniref:Uncharacterized protein n=1 Tax=Meloidogyne enterolobii TaxID=390850 RepID=A0ACB0XZP6_MELEN